MHCSTTTLKNATMLPIGPAMDMACSLARWIENNHCESEGMKPVSVSPQSGWRVGEDMSIDLPIFAGKEGRDILYETF